MGKKYIIITADIHPVGGMQWLTAGKANALEDLGWETFVFYASHSHGKCEIPELERFDEGGFYELLLPPYKWSQRKRNKVISKMVALIGYSKDDEIIIESHYDCASQWGEILAARTRAKHYLFLCNEIYRGPGKYYTENMDFYNFKLGRRELSGEMDDIFYKLFEGYKDVSVDDIVIFKYDENPIRNVNNSLVDRLERANYNICYIGRTEKGYFPNIVEGVAAFSKKHSEKDIKFIIVGDTHSRELLLSETFGTLSNITVERLGNVVPIPTSLFDKVDVVIAGSGSAKCAAYEGTYAIVADASNFKANGVLGYDTNDELYHRNSTQRPYEDILEDVLVTRKYDDMKSILPKYMGPRECTEQNLELINKSVNEVVYYPEEKLCAPFSGTDEAFRLSCYNFLYRYIPGILNSVVGIWSCIK